MKKSMIILANTLIIFNLTSCSNLEEDTVVQQYERSNIDKIKNNIPDNGGVKLLRSAKFFQQGDIGRYWKSAKNVFLYTTSPTEAPSDYTFQMSLGKASSGGTAAIGRYYNPSTGDRLLTVSNEVSNNPSWVYEGNIGYGWTTPQISGSLSDTHPVYRYRKYDGGRHLFTTDYNEVGGGNSYWIYEGIAFHLTYN